MIKCTQKGDLRQYCLDASPKSLTEALHDVGTLSYRQHNDTGRCCIYQQEQDVVSIWDDKYELNFIFFKDQDTIKVQHCIKGNRGSETLSVGEYDNAMMNINIEDLHVGEYGITTITISWRSHPIQGLPMRNNQRHVETKYVFMRGA